MEEMEGVAELTLELHVGRERRKFRHTELAISDNMGIWQGPLLGECRQVECGNH